MEDWQEIVFDNDEVKVQGDYYTSVRSVYYSQKESIVRISWMSDRCKDSEFLEYLYQKLPQLKGKKLVRVYDDNFEWLCDWNCGSPSGGPFQLTVFFFEK